jgi:hypothetical protein
MVQVKNGIGSNVLLTITDRKGNVVFHETVKACDVETVTENILRSIS